MIEGGCQKEVKGVVTLLFRNTTANRVLNCILAKKNELTLFPKEVIMMKSVLLSGHHLLLTEAIKSLATEKFQKLFRHDPKIIRAKVELEEERDSKSPTKLQFTAKAILEGVNIVASATSEDLYKSIDLLVRKLDGQLRRKHGSVQAKRKYALQAA